MATVGKLGQETGLEGKGATEKVPSRLSLFIFYLGLVWLPVSLAVGTGV